MSQTSFEQLIKKIETIIHQLENGDVDLEQSLKLFKEGSAKIKLAQNKLKQLEHEFETIKLDAQD